MAPYLDGAEPGHHGEALHKLTSMESMFMASASDVTAIRSTTARARRR